MHQAVVRSSLVLVLALVVGSAACGGDTTDTSEAPAYAADAEGLTSLMSDIRAAAAANDTARAAALTRGLFPDRATIATALRDGSEEALAKIVAMHERLTPKTDEEAAGVLAGKPERSEIQVHASTTEDLAAYAKGTPAYAEFPGGARTAAQTLLRPGITFYEVEFLEPGKDSGLKLHLFWHSGSSWKMLGPVWRALR